MKEHDSRSASLLVAITGGEQLATYAGLGILAETADLARLTTALSGLFAAGDIGGVAIAGAYRLCGPRSRSGRA